MNYCCTVPLPADDQNNITAEPRLADMFHLSAESPCRGAGDPSAFSGLDVDGEPWTSPPSIGCDEFHSETSAGALRVAIQSDYANARTGFALHFLALIDGHAAASSWDFGDGTVATNQPYAAHAWNVAGNYQVVLSAKNADDSSVVSADMIVHVLDAPVQYVAQAGSNPVAPFTSWATAATNIQDAVDAAFGGGTLILVSNGVYQTGGRVVTGLLTNRLAITKPMIVQSVNGPATTIIQGYQFPGAVNGDGAVRCAYLADGAKLIGFTLANGATRSGFDNNSQVEIDGGGVWCQSTNVTVEECVIVSNSCFFNGAGVYGGTLVDCQINNNTNWNTTEGGGGGAAFSTLWNCSINRNWIRPGRVGGGAYSCILSNCVLTDNSDDGTYASTLDHCILAGNFAMQNGGGAVLSTLNSCLVYNNHVPNSGGGAYDCVLNNCTVSNNWAKLGGGVYQFTNTLGQGNVLVGNVATNQGGGLYLFGNPVLSLDHWTFVSNSAASDGGGLYLTSPLILLNCDFFGNTSGGNGGGAGCNFSGHIAASDCNFIGNQAAGNGGGIYRGVLTNCFLTGNRAGNGGGVYGMVQNCAVNDNTATTNGGGLYYYNLLVIPVPPLTSCAFTNNSAVNGGGAYGGVFSNCTFSANSAQAGGGAVNGGALVNCLVVSNAAVFGGGGYSGAFSGCKIAGNSATTDGGGIYNAANPNAVVTNCLVEGNSARDDGGGVFASTLTRCTVAGNTAGGNGGGALGGSLNACIVQNNTAVTNGGGAWSASIVNSLLSGNSAAYGGGASQGFLNNSSVVNNQATTAGGGTYFISSSTIVSCIIYDNSAPVGENYSGGVYNNCCSVPLPPGSNNITNDPAFVNLAAGNFRLQTNSPCINAGNGSAGATDLDGRPRVVGGKIDMGAFEFQGAGVGEFTSWLQQYGLPTDGSADYANPDGDGLDDYQEWIAGTDPTNALSTLLMLIPTNGAPGLNVSWESVSNRTYFLERSTDLSAQPPFTALRSNLVGQAGTTTFRDATATNAGPYFYRVGVQP